MIPVDQHQVLPLVDRSVVEELGMGLADHGIARALVRDFADAWPTRFRCLETALESQDRADSLDAVLSLKTASMMVGALRLAWLAGQIESLVRTTDFTAAAAALALVDRCGAATVGELLVARDDEGLTATVAAPEPNGTRSPAP